MIRQWLEAAAIAVVSGALLFGPWAVAQTAWLEAHLAARKLWEPTPLEGIGWLTLGLAVAFVVGWVMERRR